MDKDLALETLKSFIDNTDNVIARDAVLTLHPELNESEDERIRKEILEYFNQYKDEGLRGANITPWIAYLEKQKEQKHSLNFDAISSWLRDHASRYVNSEFNEFHRCVEYDGTFDTERLIADLKAAVDNGAFDVDAAKESDKAQLAVKLIDKYIDEHTANAHDMDDSNPDKKYYSGVDDTLSDIAGILISAYSEDERQEEQPTNEEMIRTLRTEYEKGVADTIAKYEQKPVDNVSREEYVKRFKVLCDAYEIKLPNREYDIYGLCDDLSKLSIDSGKHKPAEWSEEDKSKKERLISIVKRALHGNEYPILNDDGATELITWLKSLRPHWKPSEEQMQALEHFIRSWGESGTMNPQNTILCAAKSLYNDLKKL